MKKILIFTSIILLSSCKSLDGYRIYNNTNHCFSNEDIKKVINYNSNISYKVISLNPIISNKNTCIGLYSNQVGSLKSVSGIQKILKFDNSIYIYNYKDTILNKRKLNEFLIKYHNKFSSSKLDSISLIFLKGDEILGTIY